MIVSLSPRLCAPRLTVMNFLNEIVGHYPDAVSFAPGRPFEEAFDVSGALDAIAQHAASRSARTGRSELSELSLLGQYGQTNGIIRDVVARQIALDEGIEASPEDVVVTVGCQEAMLVLLMTLFEPGDALLVTDPTYIGVTGLADLLRIALHPVPVGPEGLAPRVLLDAVASVRARGLRPRALYDIPDFNNPRGTSMPEGARRAVLDIAAAEEMLVFEDNPYGMFAYDGPRARTLKALDDHGVVVYLGSYSKTLFPGIRVGYIVAGQPAVDADGRVTTLSEVLSRAKSLTTVNTSPLMQAAVAGALERDAYSLEPRLQSVLPAYKERRDGMLEALEHAFRGPRALEGVSWNRPGGGFFVTLTLPFDFDEASARECAAEHGVICCPMRFFSVAGGCEREARLSFSYVTPDQIRSGIDRLAAFVRTRVRR